MTLAEDETICAGTGIAIEDALDDEELVECELCGAWVSVFVDEWGVPWVDSHYPGESDEDA